MDTTNKNQTARGDSLQRAGSEVPTPRTDKWEYEQECNFDVTWEDNCRELERELTAAKAELDAIRAVFQHGADEENWIPGTTLAESVAKLKASAGLPNDKLTHGGENL